MIEHILFKITEEEEEEDESVALDAPPFGTWAHKNGLRTHFIILPEGNFTFIAWQQLINFLEVLFSRI